VLRPGDDGYEESRLPWQSRFDPRPALIAEAADVEDVVLAVRAARDSHLPLAAQGAGHAADFSRATASNASKCVLSA
jgi:FAD/FMN-containing dehydrogenase